MMREGTLLILGHRVMGQDQLCPPARGCNTLRCLVPFVSVAMVVTTAVVHVEDLPYLNSLCQY